MQTRSGEEVESVSCTKTSLLLSVSRERKSLCRVFPCLIAFPLVRKGSRDHVACEFGKNSECAQKMPVDLLAPTHKGYCCSRITFMYFL